MDYISKLRAFIAEHGFRTKVEDGVLWGEMAFTSEKGLEYVWEKPGHTLREVKNWLGY